MAHDVPLKIETLSKGKLENFRVISHKEINSILEDTATNNSRVALYYNDAHDFILTTILGIDDKGLWLEQSQNNIENEQIVHSNKLVFVSSHLQIKVQFAIKKVSSVAYQGYPAFYMPSPASIYRLQRREFYRLMVPPTAPLQCVIAAGKFTSKLSGEFNIVDISCGGIGITCLEMNTELVLGKLYPNCQINLPDIGMIKGTIEVKTLVSISTLSGNTLKRAGCEFKNLDARSIVLLQRYVMNMQRLGTPV